MRFRHFAAAILLGVAAMATTPALTAQGGYQQGPLPPLQGQGGYYQPGPWEQPPNEFNRDLQRGAFHEGFEGARRDLENHRQPNVNNRDEFRHYRGPERRAYKQAFSRGYQTFWQHVGERRGDGDDRRRDGDDRDHRRDNDRDRDPH